PDGGLERPAAVGDEHEWLGVGLGEGGGVGAARRDPDAVSGLPGTPRNAVDGFLGLARGAEDDERNGVLPGHGAAILAPRPQPAVCATSRKARHVEGARRQAARASRLRAMPLSYAALFCAYRR